MSIKKLALLAFGVLYCLFLIISDFKDKIRIYLLFCFVLLSTFSVAETVTLDNINYDLVEKGAVASVIGKNKVVVSDLEIPKSVTYGGVTYSVTSICRYAFDSCTDLKSVTIPYGVTSIGEGAFYNCNNLVSVNIPNSVNSMGDRVFQLCQSLEFVDLPKGITSIGSSFFDCCYKLSIIDIPNGVTSIGQQAFYECKSLTSVIIPEGVTYIGKRAFYKCDGLTSVVIPEGVTQIDDNAFYQCISLTSVNIPNSVTYIGDHTFYECSRLESVTIPNGVTKLANDTFSGCKGLISVNIQDGVTSIGKNTFSGCGLTSVDIPSSVNFIDAGAFSGCSDLTSITIPNSVKTMYSHAFSHCGLTSVVVLDGLTTINEYVFYGCSKLKSVTIGNSVKTIVDGAFSGCPELEDVICLAYSVPSAGSKTFDGSYIEHSTLHVQKGAVSRYQTTEPWKNFKNIVEIESQTYTLTYFVDGEEYKKCDFEEGEQIIPEPFPAKEGCMFSGWEGLPETMPDHDVTVTGTFLINKYKLTYMVDGEKYKSYEIKYGSTIIPLDEPVKEGYTFSGWSEIPDEMPAHDVTVTGTFTKNSIGTCAAPTINVVGDKITFDCETEGVTYHYNVSCTYEKSGEGNSVELQPIYKVSVYASKDDYVDSETVIKEIKLDSTAKGGFNGDINGDGVVNAADIVNIVNQMFEGSK